MKPKSKAEFVRSMGGAPAKEVVAKAKAAGMSLTVAYVYNVRATTNRRTRAVPSRPGSAKARVSPEQALVAIASEIGLSAAIDVLRERHEANCKFMGVA